MRYKLIVQKITEMSDEEKQGKGRMNNGFINYPFAALRENEIAIIALDVELTEEEWNRVKTATIKEI